MLSKLQGTHNKYINKQYIWSIVGYLNTQLYTEMFQLNLCMSFHLNRIECLLLETETYQI